MFQTGKMGVEWFVVSLAALLLNVMVVTPLMMFCGFRCERGKREKQAREASKKKRASEKRWGGSFSARACA
jgi:hypothetical protein